MRAPGIPFIQGRNFSADPDGTKYGIAIHNTSNTATASAEASYATRRTDSVSAHFYVDSTQVIQSLDTQVKAWHAGSAAGNDHAVAVEICGVNSWNRQQWLDRVAWDKLAPVLAAVCRAYGIAVRRASVAEMKAHPRVKAFYGHDDMRQAWGGTTHTDPGPNFPWDRLFQAVNAALNPPPIVEDEDDMPDAKSYSLAPGAAYAADGATVVAADAITLITLPAARLSGAGFGDIWMSLGADLLFAGAKPKVRVAIHDGSTWHVTAVELKNGPRVDLTLPPPATANAYTIALGRIANTDPTLDEVPAALLVEIGKR